VVDPDLVSISRKFLTISLQHKDRPTVSAVMPADPAVEAAVALVLWKTDQLRRVMQEISDRFSVRHTASA